MDIRVSIVHLEKQYAEYDNTCTPAREVILAGLLWQTDYWPGLAVAWLEQGAPIDKEIVEALELVSSKEHFPQHLRHRSFAIARRWYRTHENT
jgi:hypothetical protein